MEDALGELNANLDISIDDPAKSYHPQTKILNRSILM